MVCDNVEIGDNNRFEAHVTIGTPAEHRDYFEKLGSVRIGNRNIIREFVTINSSTHGKTEMGNDCTMLRGSHLSHDSVLEDKVTVSCSVLIGGESHICKGANLGLGAIIHQRSVIGAYAMLGMGTIVTKSSRISPGNIFIGNPARLLRENKIGLQRAGVSDTDLYDELMRYEKLVRAKR